jgi:hypothetical protein
VPLNIFLRFSWAINKAGLAYHSQIITFATALLEVVRRIIWNFFRLENEVKKSLEEVPGMEKLTFTCDIALE